MGSTSEDQALTLIRDPFRLCGHLVQPQLNQIEGPAGTTNVTPKAMAVLVYLVSHEQEVVTKERLLLAVWGAAFVGEDVLPQAIYELRKAFADDARQPRVIQTIHRRGYRMMAGIEPSKDLVLIAPRGKRLWLWATLALLLVLAVVFLLLPRPVMFVQEPRDLGDDLGHVRLRVKQSLESRARARGIPKVAHSLWARQIRWSVVKDGGRVVFAADSGDLFFRSFECRVSRSETEFGVYDFVSRVLDRVTDRWSLRRVARNHEFADRAYEAGLEARLKLDLGGARLSFLNALAQREDYVPAIERLANVYEAQGRIEHALTEIDKGIAVVGDEDHTIERMLRRRRHQINEEFGAAGVILKGLHEEVLEDSGHTKRLAWHLYTHTDQIGRAIDLLKEVQTSNPEAEVMLHLGEAHRAGGNLTEARAVFEEFRKEHPDSESGWASLVDHLILTGDYPAADAELKVYQVRSSTYHFLLGELALARLKLDQAQDHFRDAYDAARLRLEKANAKSRAAWVALQRGQLEQADSLAEEALSSKPLSMEALMVQGLVALGRSRPSSLAELAAAKEKAEEMLGIRDPQESLLEVEYYDYLRSEIARAEGDLEAAREHLRSALLRVPRDPAFYATALGSLLEQDGQWLEAAASYRQALAFDAREPGAHQGLQRVEQRLEASDAS